VIIYEVNVEYNPKIEAAYRAWLKPHIAEIVVIDGFMGCKVEEVLNPTGDWKSLCLRYELRDRDALDQYLEGHAPRLRKDAVDHFGEDFKASRRVLRVL